MARDSGPLDDSAQVQFTGFLGVNNVANETNVPKNQFREAVNVDIDPSGSIIRRSGFTSRLSHVGKNQVWAGQLFPYMLYVQDGSIKALDANLNAAATLASVDSSTPVTFWEVNGNVFFSDDSRIGLITPDLTVHPVFATNPTQQPAVAVTSSSGLPGGNYQLAMTYIDALGRESGTDIARQGTVPEGGGLQLTFPTAPSDAVTKRVYLSYANGEDLFLVGQYPAGLSSALVGPTHQTKKLATQFFEPMDAGHIIRTLNARLFVAHVNRIQFSQALRYGQMSRDDNYIVFKGRIRMMEPVSEATAGTGLFVSDDKRTYFLGGAEPEGFSQVVAYPYPAVEGTSIQVPGSYLGLSVTTLVPYWLATNGVFCIGQPNGQVAPMSETYALAPRAQSGTSFVRDVAGIHQILTNLAGLGGAQVAAASDSAVARVVRNGVVVQ